MTKRFAIAITLGAVMGLSGATLARADMQSGCGCCGKSTMRMGEMKQGGDVQNMRGMQNMDDMRAGRQQNGSQPALSETQTLQQNRTDPATIAKLQEASQEALREARNGNKNNPVFLQKSWQINDLVRRMQNGEQVDPAEIDKALEPAHVW